ncbi:MAG: hypothetical protein ACOVQ2_02385 [Flavobacterium sp.]
MKIFIFFLLFFSFGLNAQNKSLKFISNNSKDHLILDSISYSKVVVNENQVITEVNLMLQKLQEVGFFDAKYELIEDSKTTIYRFDLGKSIQKLIIEIPKTEQSYFNFETIIDNKVVLHPKKYKLFVQKALKKYDDQGNGFINIQLKDIERKNDIIYANLSIKNVTTRIVNEIIVNGYPKFPKGHFKRLKRRFKGEKFSQELIKKIANTLDNINFIKQNKYPEVLFKKDSTQIYIYIEKQNNNQFDGFLGFVNNENQQLTFTGYLDLKLRNIINSGENLQINWRNDGKNQSSFALKLDLPLLFNTSFGLETSLNVFKQDSLFQNTKTSIKLNYLLPNDSQISLGLIQNSSNALSKIVPTNLQDFENSFYNFSFNISKNDFKDILFPEQYLVDFSTGLGNRKNKNLSVTQYFISLNGFYHYILNSKNSIFIKSNHFYLNSNEYLVNELYRFGGIYSIRGFQENSLQANILSLIASEYRYRLSPGLYLHSVLDYCYYEDTTSNMTKKLIGLGLGMGLNTKNGLFRLNYATGFEQNNSPSFQNALLHFSFISRF